MAKEIKVIDLAAELKSPKTIQAPSPHEASPLLARLLRFPNELKRHLEQLLADMQVEVEKRGPAIYITSQRKQA